VSLNRLRIQDFRCLQQVDLVLNPERNYVFGVNASGKTSLLEAVHFLSRGRSFRTRRSRSLIRYGADQLTIVGEIHTPHLNHRVGASLGSEGLRLRLDGDVAGAADTTRVLPVQVIDPEVHRLIDGGPESRRRYLDWGVFHVEHGYIGDWRRFRRVLGQRNAALKVAGRDLSTWSQALVDTAVAVDAARQRYVQSLVAPLEDLGERLLGLPVEISYRKGWAADLSFREALDRSLERDRQQGSTQVGPHRGELRIQLAGAPVREQASRGQQKLISAAMTLAQTELFATAQGRRSLLLVDDPAAELDGANLARFLEALWSTPAQLLVTGLSPAVLPPAPGFPVFHVEQGNVREVV
jgi:DNA replication and repair protein RecF